MEVLHVELVNPEAHFEELIKFFFMFHGEFVVWNVSQCVMAFDSVPHVGMRHCMETVYYFMLIPLY